VTPGKACHVTCQTSGTPNSRKTASLLISDAASTGACARSLRPEGSRWAPGMRPARRACSMVIGTAEEARISHNWSG
jgi:hypothetical protein